MDEHDVDPDVLLANRGYDSDTIRDDLGACGGTPQITTKKNRRRIATRYDHIASSFLSFVLLAAIRQWISFVLVT